MFFASSHGDVGTTDREENIVYSPQKFLRRFTHRCKATQVELQEKGLFSRLLFQDSDSLHGFVFAPRGHVDLGVALQENLMDWHDKCLSTLMAWISLTLIVSLPIPTLPPAWPMNRSFQLKHSEDIPVTMAMRPLRSGTSSALNFP